MFRRNNNDSKNNRQPADKEIRDEDRAEKEIQQKVGNQAASGMPPLLPPNVGNQALNELLNDHYAENMLNIPPLINSRQMDEIIDEAPDLLTRTARKPVKKQKRSSRNTGTQSVPSKANAPLADLVSPGMNLGKAEKPNVDEILNRRQQIEDKFKIREMPHKDNSIIDNTEDDESDRFIKIRNFDDDQSEHNGSLKLISIPENDSKHPVNNSPSGGMPEWDEDEKEIIPENYDEEEEIDNFNIFDPDTYRKIRNKKFKSPLFKNGKLDLHIPDTDIFASDSEEENGSDDEEEIGENDIDTRRSVTKRLQEEAKKKKKLSKKEAPKEEDDSFDTYGIEEDLVPRTGPKKGKNNKRNKKHHQKPPRLSKADVGNLKGIEEEYWKSGARERARKMAAAYGEEGQEQAFSAKEMEKIQNWDFQAQKLDEAQKPSKLRRFLSYVARGAGNLMGAALNIITLGHFMRAKSQARFMLKDENSWQQEKDHQSIPGWEGAKYDPGATKGEDVIADFRRVPTVWSHLTAAKAAEKVIKNGKETEKPLDPVVSVLVDQPKSESTQSMEGTNMGHVMLGIEYSRKSLVSNRYERYKLQYGFYPAKEMLRKISTLGTGMKDNAYVPGLLNDDSDQTYDISRSYPAKPAQVNAIFQASEKYADGGYSVYDRNCATFVKDMVVNTAHLATGGEIFKQSEITFSHLANAGMAASAAVDQSIKGGAESALMDLSGVDAESYENYGNKKVTKRDWNNYKESMGKSSKWTKKTYVPAEIAEHMRRMEGEGTGEIGTKKNKEALKNKEGKVFVTLNRLINAIDKKADNFQEKNEALLSQEQLGQAPRELFSLIGELPFLSEPINILNEKIKENLEKENEGKPEIAQIARGNINEEDFVTPDDLRTARQQLSENISKTNLLLYNYFKNDKRFHYDLMEIISLMNVAVDYIDDLYQKIARGGKDEKGSVKDIREEMTHKEYKVHADGPTAYFTPTHYESYIQIYKDPKTAVVKYNRLKELRLKKEDQGQWVEGNKGEQILHMAKGAFPRLLEKYDEMSYAEAKELGKLEKMEELALQFDNAHNYMVEKEEYSQQDIDYAFQLNYREKYGNQKKPAGKNNNVLNEDFRDNYRSASGIYITLFLDKIFHGIKQEWMKDENQGGLSLEDAKKDVNVQSWLDRFFMDRVKSKKKELQMIIRGLYRAMKAGETGKIKYDDLRERIADMLFKTLISRNFKSENTDDKETYAKAFMGNYTYTLGTNPDFQFSGVINSMIAACLKEGREKPLDNMVFDK